ncbi:hypothetical protein [Microbulbifer sp. M83]|uniref:hypothetical protein n=1 Tax=Microbulbifer sp. M83 TaxID=3118246 RepID=UPI002FE0FB28
MARLASGMFRLLLVQLLWATGVQATQAATETLIVVVRHAEKPAQGLGLLTCQGLNRAIRLPGYFREHFPRPDYIFAPDPSVKATEIHGDGQRHDYVRPLLTIGPTAVDMQVPINTQIPYNDPGLLADTLLSEPYLGSTVYVAWEHMNIDLLAKILLRRFDSSSEVPEWPNSDYDTVFVFRLSGVPGSGKIKLEVDQQGLDGMDKRCPAGSSEASR